MRTVFKSIENFCSFIMCVSLGSIATSVYYQEKYQVIAHIFDELKNEAAGLVFASLVCGAVAIAGKYVTDKRRA